jgi:ABC-type dipeptide/oligopeptide/nickel transport system permease subunit
VSATRSAPAVTTGKEVAQDDPLEASSPRTWRRLLRQRNAVIGLSLLAVYAVVAIVGPLVLRFDPVHQDLDHILLPPSPGHLLGTDNYGRDELLALIFGARATLAVGLLAVAVGVGIGAPLGALSGYLGGWADLLVQRLAEVLLAFPSIVLALALVAGLGPGLRNVVIAVGIGSIPGFIRVARASALQVRGLMFVEAARALGVPTRAILLRHVLPNTVAPLIVQATVQVGFAILVAAGLGFFGLGVQPPTPEWGELLGEAHLYIFRDANLVTFPGLCILGAVLAFNLAGDGLRDALDPRLG